MLPKGEFLSAEVVGTFWLSEVGDVMRVRRAALYLLGFISWLEWESSVSFPPGPVAETSRETSSWWSDR